MIVNRGEFGISSRSEAVSAGPISFRQGIPIPFQWHWPYGHIRSMISWASPPLCHMPWTRNALTSEVAVYVSDSFLPGLAQTQVWTKSKFMTKKEIRIFLFYSRGCTCSQNTNSLYICMWKNNRPYSIWLALLKQWPCSVIYCFFSSAPVLQLKW